MVRTESDTSLGDREEKEDGKTSVETLDTVRVVSVLDGVFHTLLGEFLIELHLGLQEFSGVSDGDFNTTSNTTGNDRLEGVLTLGVAVRSHFRKIG